MPGTVRGNRSRARPARSQRADARQCGGVGGGVHTGNAPFPVEHEQGRWQCGNQRIRSRLARGCQAAVGQRRAQRLARANVEFALVQRTFDFVAFEKALAQVGLRMRADIVSGVDRTVDLL